MELVKEEKRKVIEAEIRLKVMLTTETQSRHTHFYGMMKVRDGVTTLCYTV